MSFEPTICPMVVRGMLRSVQRSVIKGDNYEDACGTPQPPVEPETARQWEKLRERRERFALKAQAARKHDVNSVLQSPENVRAKDDLRNRHDM